MQEPTLLLQGYGFGVDFCSLKRQGVIMQGRRGTILASNSLIQAPVHAP